MNEYEANEIVKKQLCKEVVRIAEKIEKTGDMSEQDLERLDKLYHAKKSLVTVLAMEEAEEGQGGESYASGNQNGMSGRRGRSSVTGRYVSREGGSSREESNASFAEGYSQGYSEAMSRMSQAGGGNSGHYPMMPGYERRW